ncbi:putative mucin/carbohydrate-binding domain-containing protein [Pseudomonas sp. PDM27]|uniref:putative mucin/carbohydrate-binding domain-containing protein n=1 Tax=Pseudomonas sp. PDM27 TaxID=2854769 RepID=UPI001C48C354|nr:putative mucin/carbohydrate-binding domain-containing protein [Pseudomonas sp. PDM27]MBV7570332.1 M60 family metallopeptidase [Pseudomonas sp. PDM27]
MADEGIDSITYVVSSLERPDWLIAAGLDKGLRHDRTETGGLKGTVLSVGSTIRFRQTSPMSNMGVILGLLNDDQKTEEHLEVTVEWREFCCKHASVPFLSTPYTDVAGQLIAIDVEVSGSQKILPVYQAGGNAGLFFQLWDLQSAEYALFVSDYAQILIPAKDKEVLRALHQTSGLQALTAYYNGVFEYFNYLAGLSFEPLAPTDKNIPNRYFMKADKSGAGAGYYSGGWTAETSDSVAAFWLDIKATNWGSLHEIGHGYQGKFMANSSINMAEVWNNVLAASYQNKMLGEAVYEKGWLYGRGEEKLYKDAMAALDSENAIEADSLRLFFYMLMFQRMGERGIVEFFQRYRRLSNGQGFKVEDHPAMELLSSVAVDVANIDVSTYMAYAEAPLASRQEVENAYSNAAPVFPLYLLVSQDELRQVQDLLGLRSPLSLVSCAELAVTGLTGDVSFNFEEPVYHEIVGMVFLLRDGKGPARILKITSPRVVVSGLPVGLYVLHLPDMAGGDYQSVTHYAVVKSGRSDVDCIYVRKYASTLANQVVYLNGLVGVFCTVAVDVSRGTVVVDVVSESPHSYFVGEVYAAVTLRDDRGRVVFSRMMMGDKTTLFHQELAIEKDFTVAIFHKEPSRLTASNSAASQLIDEVSQTNRLKVTVQGLVNVELGTDSGANLKSAIEKCVGVFEQSPHLVLHADYPVKNDLRQAINSFAEPIRSELFERYRAVEFFPPAFNRSLFGSVMTWGLQGNGGRDIGYLKMKLALQRLDIVLSGGAAHEYFSSVYMSVVVKSASGEIVYFRELRGDESEEASTVTLPFAPGSTVSVMHREPTRCWIVKDSLPERTSVERVQHVKHLAYLKLMLSS